MISGICYDGYSMYIIYTFIGNRNYFALQSPASLNSLVIIDPYNQWNNVTASLYRFAEIRKCFSNTLTEIYTKNR